MSNKIFFLIVIWSAAFALWAWGNPPSGAPGTTSGAISIDANGDISVSGKKIVNLAAPATSTDAVTKDYVDRYGAVGGTAIGRIWGQGRENVTVLTSSGECTSSLNANIKVSRSSRNAHWDGAAAVCPAGWWVCTEGERGTNYCNNAGFGQQSWVNCSIGAPADEFTTGNTASAWVANSGSVGSNRYTGRIVNNDGTPSGTTNAQNQEVCSIMPVWCCAYK